MASDRSQGESLATAVEPAAGRCALCEAAVPASGGAYCCAGCERVAGILAQSGLSGRPGSGSPRAVSESNPEPCDDERVWSARLTGLWCPSCAWLIESVVGQLDGVREARVTFLSDRAEVRFDPARVSEAAIEGKIAELGYGVSREPQARVDRGLYVRFGFAAVASANVMMLSYAHHAIRTTPGDEALTAWLAGLLAALSAATVFVAGAPILRRGLAAVAAGRATMETSIGLAAVSALGYSGIAAWRGEGSLYFDVGSSLVALWLLGRIVERTAFLRATEAGAAVRRLLPTKARVARSGGSEWVDASSIQTGEIVAVAANERVPVDGRVIGGAGMVTTAVVDGEPRPRRVEPGDAVAAGSANGASTLLLEVTAPAHASTLARIAEHVARATGRRGTESEVTDALARAMLGGVLLLALVTLAGWVAQGAGLAAAFERALAVLVVSCPCALAVAAPLARVVAAGSLARRGVVVRQDGALDAIARARVAAFDKTGTLTLGEPSLELADACGGGAGEALEALARLERPTDHPVARAVRRALGNGVRNAAESAAAEPETGWRLETGGGVAAELDGWPAAAGSPAWVERQLRPLPPAARSAVARVEAAGASALAVAYGRGQCAVFAVQDTLRSEAAGVMAHMRQLGLETAVLSGDGEAAVASTALALGISTVRGRLTPEGKAEWLEELAATSGERALFVGDGINDAPAMAAAVGVAVASGTDFARESAAVLLLEPDLERVPELVDAARRMQRVIRQNFFWAATYNLVAIPLAAAGRLDPLIAAAAMVVSSIAVTLNSLRAGARHAARKGAGCSP